MLARRRRLLFGNRFSPLSLSPALWLKADGVLWQDAARTTPAVADGDPVGCWDDASGNGYQLSQSTAGKRPTLKFAIQNGRPVLRFDGVDDLLSVTSAALGAAFKLAHTVLCVSLVRANAAGFQAAFGPSVFNGGTNDYGYLSLRDSGPSCRYGLFAGSGATQVVESVEVGAAAHQYTVGYHATSTLSYCRDGGAVLTASSNPGAAAPNTVTVGAVQRLNSATGLGFSPADLCEILVYGSWLDGAAESRARSYQRQKWGTP